MYNKTYSQGIGLVFLAFSFLFADDLVRQPAAAGTFYPENPQKLKRFVNNLLQQTAEPSIDGEITGLITPHAGYIYSGKVAASAYAALNGQRVHRIILIGPSHVARFKGAAIFNGTGYSTPLGTVPIDQDFSQKLSEQHDLLRLSSDGHTTRYKGRGEHALEVQLPFLQQVLGDFRIVTVIMGNQDYETCRALGQGLARLITDRQTVIIASSDLSHYHSYKKAVHLDNQVIKAIKNWDYLNLWRNIQNGVWESCGAGPIVATMMAIENLGATQSRLLQYANSGDVPKGQHDRVVGYAAFAFSFSNSQYKSQSSGLNLKPCDQNELLQLAQKSVEQAVLHNKPLNMEQSENFRLNQPHGVFVTLNANGKLRGCIGYTAPVHPLCQLVCRAAFAAAKHDPRFTPVTPDELHGLTFQISVLSPFRRVLNFRDIKVGKHGLLVKCNRKEGLLLPQVAVEQKWDRQTFIEQTCCKAGLPPDAWKDEGTDFYQFTAFVFGN
ncbi:MAG: AmmeMemoRadiSam system protein B [Caldithrix sp.]|nr:AmmeMemoRadiSam system protein B [Caldithrix sp.]